MPRRYERWQSPLPEILERLQNAYDILLYFGAHGQPNHPILGNRARAVEREYAHVSYCLQDIGPGDMVMAESYGYENYVPDINAKHLRVMDILHPGYKQTVIREVAGLRKRHNIDTWHYALALAAFKGAETRYADCDAEARKRHLRRANMIDLQYLRRSTDPDELALAAEFDHERISAACQNMVDWAVGNLPEAEAHTNPRKSRIVMFYGKDHFVDLSAMMLSCGLTIASTQIMPEVNDAERLAELFGKGRANQ